MKKQKEVKKQPMTYTEFVNSSTRYIADGIITEGFKSLDASVIRTILLYNQYMQENGREWKS